MLELLFLLLPVAVLYGWYIGYRKAYQEFNKAESTRFQKIVSGVRFLLEGKKSKASEYLVDLLNDESDSYEAHLALAEVYRNRGDFDRAIKLHEELYSSKDIPKTKTDLASYELAKDFIAVSLYDKAIELLKAPIFDPDLQFKCISLLIKTYQRLGDWDDAMSLIEKNRDRLSDKYTVKLYSQFLCEKAQRALMAGKIVDGEKFITEALTINPSSTRGMIMKCDLLNGQGNNKVAIDLLEEIVTNNPDMVLIALPSLRKCYILPQELDAYMKTIEGWMKKTSSSEIIIEYASLLLKTDRDAARKLVVNQLRLHPSIKLFAELLNLQILSTNDKEACENMGLILTMINDEEAKRNTFSCHSCGFSSRVMFWKCPSCGEWDTIKPITGFEGD